MNDRNHITTPHSFNEGDIVTVCKRVNPNFKYTGKIYKIINKLENSYIKNTHYVDYFYITFDKNVYDKILLKGWNIIVNDKDKVIANIERNELGEIVRLYIQCDENDTFIGEEINIEDINAILIWRVAFNIEYGKIK